MIKKNGRGRRVGHAWLKENFAGILCFLYDLGKIQHRICSQIILCVCVFHENRPGGSYNPLRGVNTFHSNRPHVSFRPDEIQYKGFLPVTAVILHVNKI